MVLPGQAADGWGNRTVIGFLIAGAVLLVVWIIVELLVKDPVIDLRLFRSYTFTIANILIWATTALLFGSIFLLPLFFERVEGLSSLYDCPGTGNGRRTGGQRETL